MYVQIASSSTEACDRSKSPAACASASSGSRRTNRPSITTMGGTSAGPPSTGSPTGRSSSPIVGHPQRAEAIGRRPERLEWIEQMLHDPDQALEPAEVRSAFPQMLGPGERLTDPGVTGYPRR